VRKEEHLRPATYIVEIGFLVNLESVYRLRSWTKADGAILVLAELL
jgi:hypothetical protein